MYIRKIHIENYRNYNNFTMEFHDGLNVIIGANNAGKTGLLYAIKLLSTPFDITFDDFNKNNLKRYKDLYLKTPPAITIEYEISHTIREDDTDDESIIRLLPFLGVKGFAESRHEASEGVEYNIEATIKAVFSLDVKYLEEYRTAVKNADYKKYLSELKALFKKYSWHYSNGVSDTKAEQKAVTDIFNIRFIDAERTSAEINKETRQEISEYINKKQDYTQFIEQAEDEIKEYLEEPINALADVFQNENNDIGLEKGNISISSAIQTNLSLPDTYIIEVKDTKGDYSLPLHNNGLGYNNLINIYMLIKMTGIHPGKDFHILCLEEPEAHLHPAMQYKLFKYLKKQNDKSGLNQQIFVTTHSSNISAVAGLDNMFMVSYNRSEEIPECTQQSLKEQFTDKDGTKDKAKAKAHLTKFLDVTRSDMLYADKVILVEGIAEKLLMPLFMEICNCPYEDEHISIVEIGGKHFNYFVELFNQNAVKKKILCITDKDFGWNNPNDNDRFYDYSCYKNFKPEHIEKLEKRFPIDNLKIVTQFEGGRTFEDELFLVNLKNDEEVAKRMLRIAAGDRFGTLINSCPFSIKEWRSLFETSGGRSKEVVLRMLNYYRDDAPADGFDYDKLTFAEIFLHYAKEKKGNVALEMLTDEAFINDEGESKLIAPKYIQEGLIWLLK